MNFPYLFFHLPFERGVALHLNKLESSSPKNALGQVLLKLDLYNYLPFEKGLNFHLNKFDPLYMYLRMFCAKFD